LVVGRCNKSGRYVASKESDPKSAPKPPEAKIMGPNSWGQTGRVENPKDLPVTEKKQTVYPFIFI